MLSPFLFYRKPQQNGKASINANLVAFYQLFWSLLYIYIYTHIYPMTS